MQSNNERGETTPQSRSRVDASPTGRILDAGASPRFLFVPLLVRPAQGKCLAFQQRDRRFAVEIDFTEVERRFLAANPEVARRLLKR